MQNNTIAHATSRKANTPAMELRDTLTELERHIGKINHSDRDALKAIPDLFQATSDLIDKLGTVEANVASEEVRFETLSRQFHRAKRNYIKRLGGMNTYTTQLSDETRPETDWWWHLDTLIAKENHLRRIRTLRNTGIAIGAFIVIAILYMLFLAPDEITRETVRLESEAERAMMAGDYAAALPPLNEVVQVNPAETRLWIFRGVVHELLGNEAQAEADYAFAREQDGDEVAFLVERSQIYMSAKLPEIALQDAEYAIVLDPESPLAHYQAGAAHNILQHKLEAISAFERCAELAHAQDMTELEGMARVQMAYIYGGQ